MSVVRKSMSGPEARAPLRSAVDRQAERHPAGELLLLAVGQRVEARTLDVAERALQAHALEEAGAAGGDQRQLDRLDRAARHQGAMLEDLVGGLGAGLRLLH